MPYTMPQQSSDGHGPIMVWWTDVDESSPPNIMLAEGSSAHPQRTRLLKISRSTEYVNV